ncbi:uncharacterized protein LOC143076003 [Mytilus galloprovincialis]|uniref:uncharacterized protein LOC143076003 n=1 Tax=Mytilus galloprovincialis TaxID=29158 RepID=UPI003F7C3954
METMAETMTFTVSEAQVSSSKAADKTATYTYTDNQSLGLDDERLAWLYSTVSLIIVIAIALIVCCYRCLKARAHNSSKKTNLFELSSDIHFEVPEAIKID